MTAKNLSPALVEALSRVRQSMPADQTALADRMATINARHLKTFRDDAFAAHVDRMKRGLVAHYSGDEKQYRMILVVGSSHSGKSTLVEHALDNDPAFHPYVDSEGTETVPVLRFQAPSPCTLRNLAVDGLEALGFPVKSDIVESRAWPLFRQQLKHRKVLFIFIDEAQQTINSNNEHEIQKLRDTFKHLVQMDDWPIRLILAGVSPLERLREDMQIRSRSTVLNVGDLDPVAHRAHVVHWVTKIVNEHAELALEDFLNGDFPEKLVHACGGCFGSIVESTRLAVEHALIKGVDEVGVAHFATAYAQRTGCSSSNNIFTAEDWRSLAPGAARKEDAKAAPAAAPTPAADAMKPLRGGERRK